MTTATQSTLDDLVAAIRQLTAKYPNFKYTPADNDDPDGSGCSYHSGGDALYPSLFGCIVGQAFRKIGISIDPDESFDSADHIIDKYLPASGDASEETQRVNWVTTVQSVQDGGKCWRDAVYTADRRSILK